MHCHYKLQDGTEQRQEICVANLERLLRTLPTAAIDEGLVSQVVDSKTATVRALDLSGQCADEAQNYRAIVASKRTESTATALTDLQKRFLCELRANADEERLIGDHASMYRLEEPGDRDSFLWRPIGHEATLCKPTTGHIIVCLDGECTVMNSQEALKCIKDAGNIRPVCAAIAVALYTKRAESYGIAGDQATAFSDHSGSWLERPATCTSKRHTGIQCTCFLTDGTTDFTEILWKQLSPYNPPVSDATEGGASHADTGYRAIVPSKDKPDARELSQAQAELLGALKESKLKLVSNEYATLSRTGEDGDDVLRWSNLAPESTLCKPVKDQIIVCIDGQCTVVSSERAMSIFTGTHGVRQGTRSLGPKPAKPACAALVLALHERRLHNSTVTRAEALSTPAGEWLHAPATCTAGSRSLDCTYTLKGGVEQKQNFTNKEIESAVAAWTQQPRVPVSSEPAAIAGGCEEAQQYRAIVASNDQTKPSTVTALTDLQRGSLCALLQDPGTHETSNEAGSLSRAHDSFLWMPTDPDATLRKPVPGQIILWLNGKCTVMSSQSALQRIAPDSRNGSGITPECAAIAIAFDTLYKEPVPTGGIQRMVGLTAWALSDNDGRWLKRQASCELLHRMGVICKYVSQAGKEESTVVYWDQFVTETPGPSTQVSASSAGQQMSADTGWFKDLFGFLDTNEGRNDAKFARDKEKFTYDAKNGVLSSVDKPGTTWKAGTFTTPSLQELRTGATAQMQNPQKAASTVTYVTGDISILHGDPKYAGAVFQAASQFNCLEFGNKTDIPELGVARWYHDHTQGPACAISCAPGTIVRTYFAHGGTRAQAWNDQINTLDNVNEYLRKKANASEPLVDVTNGYTDSDSPRLETLKTTIQNLSADARTLAMGLLKIGVQKDTQVTCTKRETRGEAPYAPWLKVEQGPPLIVTQVYASALAVSGAYANGTPEEWEPLARLVLEAAYEATLYAAVLHAHKKGAERQKVVLTALGGGVFGNKPAWIAEAVVKAIAKFKNAGLDIVINEFAQGQPEEIRQALMRNEETKGLVSGQSSFGPRARRFARAARHVVMYTE